MIWQIKNEPWEVYSRNPLDTVVAQLRFQPILKIKDESGIADFQESVRKHFPGYREGEIRSLTIEPDAQVSSKSEKVFYFLREDDRCTVQIATDNVLVESKKHATRDTLLDDLKIVVDALLSTYEPVRTTRFGVRYINVVNTGLISSDLGRDVTLSSAISGEYLNMPASIADLERTAFAHKISSPMDYGGMTLRYGIPPTEDSGGSLFHFDIDRFVDEPVDLSQIDKLLMNFTDDIFSLFHTMPGEDLWQWMSTGHEAENRSEAK